MPHRYSMATSGKVDKLSSRLVPLGLADCYGTTVSVRSFPSPPS